MSARLTAFDIRRLAVAAEVDPRTVRRVLDARPVHRSTRSLILGAAARLGLLSAFPVTETAAAA